MRLGGARGREMGALLWVMVVLCALGHAYKVVVVWKGKGKVISLLHLLPLFLYLPWLPSSCHIRTFLAMVFLWTAPCKLLLLCLNTPFDPLPWLSSSFSHFLVATCLPIRISTLSFPSSTTKPGYGAVKLLFLLAILNFYPLYPTIPDPLRYFLYCCHFYLGLDLFLSSVASMVSTCFSVSLYPQFDKPLSSSCLAEFWGRRWNKMVNGVLRATVYEPALRGMARSGRVDAEKGKVLAVMATFAVSGVLHELIFVYVSHSAATGEMTAFFVLHGLATVAEVAVSKRWAGRRGLPTWMRRALTLAFLYATVSWFFLRPLRRSGTDLQAIAEYHQLQAALFSPFLTRGGLPFKKAYTPLRPPPP